VLATSRQQLTKIWWQVRLPDYAPVISKTVLDEINDGDPQAAARRLVALAGIEVLEFLDEIPVVAHAFLAQKAVPAKAREDAFHLATCAIYHIPFLVTWNFKHISNDAMWERMRHICEQFKLPFPRIIQPVI
jgi:hypothetical protein